MGRSSVAVLPYCQALSKFPSHIQQVGGWVAGWLARAGQGWVAGWLSLLSGGAAAMQTAYSRSSM
jgi:hypothetical protein